MMEDKGVGVVPDWSMASILASRARISGEMPVEGDDSSVDSISGLSEDDMYAVMRRFCFVSCESEDW